MRDAYGLVPPHIKANYEREEMVDQMARAALPILLALRAKDRRLDLKYVGERADPEWGQMPGRWHVVRYNDPPAANSYMPIVDPRDGHSFREPDFGVLKELDNRDLWKHGIPEHKPTKPKTDEGMIEELAHDIRAGSRVAGEGGLTARKWGRGRKGLVGT